ncbi:MAG: phosphodiester glycosidase family protein [Oscillospiraceae bacterium]|nr:phosphodiester glycosidase family protein [Oscillospiraceae bacterium]
MTESILRYRLVKTMVAWCGGKKGGSEHLEILNLYNSHTPLPRGYAVKPTDAYCATTVSAAAIKCGIGNKTVIECSCAELIKQAKAKGWWVENDGCTPKIADLCLYDWQDSGKGDNVGAPDHVGMVVASSEEGFTVAEGNMSGGAIGFRFMERDGKYIRGFICPDYAGIAKIMESEDKAVSQKRVRYYTHPDYSYVTVLEIPISEIRKIDFTPAKQPRETLKNFYDRQTDKPGFICNAGFFSMTDGTPCFGQVDEGVVRVNDTRYNEGFGVLSGDLTRLVYGRFTDGGWKDFLSAYPMLVKGGKKLTEWSYATELNYKAVRSIIGYNDETIFYVHVGKPGMNFSQMASVMLGLGCTYAMNLDGGGSARALLQGSVIGTPTENRAVDSVLAIYFKADAKFNPYPTPSVMLKKLRLNIAGNKWLQWELNSKGYDCGAIDGVFGTNTENAVKAFQRDNGLEVDGIAGLKTIAALTA